jgi:hypothetical protein
MFSNKKRDMEFILKEKEKGEGCTMRLSSIGGMLYYSTNPFTAKEFTTCNIEHMIVFLHF